MKLNQFAVYRVDQQTAGKLLLLMKTLSKRPLIMNHWK